jgi:hypothetical protein
MTTANTRERAFQRLLAREVGTGGDPRVIAAAARRLCERFARQVSPLIGAAGVAAIWARSLHLTERQFPSLAPLRSSGQNDEPFTHLQVSLENQEPMVATRAAVGLLTTAGDLLALFIGENLTTRLLREAWPDDFAGGTTKETTP